MVEFESLIDLTDFGTVRRDLNSSRSSITGTNRLGLLRRAIKMNWSQSKARVAPPSKNHELLTKDATGLAAFQELLRERDIRVLDFWE